MITTPKGVPSARSRAGAPSATAGTAAHPRRRSRASEGVGHAAGIRRLHPRPPRVRTALAHLAHRRQLGRIPAGFAAAAHAGAGHRLRPRHHHRRPGRTGAGRAGHRTGAAPPTCWSRHAPRPRTAGSANIHFAVGDVHALDYPDDTFCVVHAHQVLQHVGDPVQALREMRRVTKPGGIVAVRDADYSAMTWYPEVDGDDRLAGAVSAGGPRQRRQPDAGRRLHAWARAGRLRPRGRSPRPPTPGATAPRRSGPGGANCGRTARSPPPTRGSRWTAGTPRRTGLDRIARAWREWGADEDGWFAMLHGEILCRA